MEKNQYLIVFYIWHLNVFHSIQFPSRQILSPRTSWWCSLPMSHERLFKILSDHTGDISIWMPREILIGCPGHVPIWRYRGVLIWRARDVFWQTFSGHPLKDLLILFGMLIVQQQTPDKQQTKFQAWCFNHMFFVHWIRGMDWQ